MSHKRFHTISWENRRKILSKRYLWTPQRPAAPPVAPHNGNKWVPDYAMSDEFVSSNWNLWPGSSRWDRVNPKWAGRAPSWFKGDNVFVQNNALHIRSRLDTPPHYYDKRYHSYSTGFVRTKTARRYGYFEIMCRLMDNKISSAFWFANDDGTTWTELDVFEYSTSDKPMGNNLHHKRMFNTNYHIHRYWDSNVQPYKTPKSYDVGFDLSSRRIKVGFNWQQNYLEWYLNDVLIRREPNYHFHQPLHLQLDSETMPDWFGLPGYDGRYNKLPNQFKIFYVRSWYQQSI